MFNHGWWQLEVGGWRLAVDGWWRLVVGGPWGRSLRAVHRRKKNWVRTALLLPYY